MILLVSHEGIEWSFHFGPDSVTLTVKDLAQQMTQGCREPLLAAWSLLLSQRQAFLNNRIAEVPYTPKFQGFMEMRDDVFLSVGAENKDTIGYQESDLEAIEFHWENADLEVDALFRPGLDTPFSPSIFVDLEMYSLAENPILIDEKQDKKNIPRLPTTSVSERSTQPLVLMRNRFFGARMKIVPDFV